MRERERIKNAIKRNTSTRNDVKWDQLNRSDEKQYEKKNKSILSIFVLILFFFGTGAIVLHLTNVSSVKAEESEISTKKASGRMVMELNKERELVEEEKQRLEQLRDQLKTFEMDLDKRYDQYLKNVKDLEDKEKEFKKKVDAKMVDRQTIETYENIDPEQAAVLISKLYEKDKEMVSLLMRKIAGKKAGKILEEMTAKDKETSARIAADTLKYFKPKNKKNN